MRASILSLCSPTQPSMEVPHATATQYTVNAESNQETATPMYRPSLGTHAHAPWTRNLSQSESYSSYDEKTFSRWYARNVDWVSCNKAAIPEGIPPAHEQALVIDASFVPTSGKHT